MQKTEACPIGAWYYWKMGKLKETIVTVLARRGVDYFIFGVLLPLGMPAVTAYAGIIQQLPLMWILMASCLSFMGITGALVFFIQLKEWLRVEHRFIFAQALIVPVIDGSGLAIKVFFQNIAQYPMFFKVLDARPIIAGHTIDTEPSMNKEAAISQAGIAFWESGKIPGTEAAHRRGQVWEGGIRIAIKYGKQNSLVHDLIVEQKLSVSFDDEGNIIGQVSTNK